MLIVGILPPLVQVYPLTDCLSMQDPALAAQAGARVRDLLAAAPLRVVAHDKRI